MSLNLPGISDLLCLMHPVKSGQVSLGPLERSQEMHESQTKHYTLSVRKVTLRKAHEVSKMKKVDPHI